LLTGLFYCDLAALRYTTGSAVLRTTTKVVEEIVVLRLSSDAAVFA